MARELGIDNSFNDAVYLWRNWKSILGAPALQKKRAKRALFKEI